MGSLSDLIEQYIREQLSRVETLEIQRRQLARMFRCVPSQINYVLETRFSVDHGFLVNSRRGGGGFIRITRIRWGQDEDLLTKFVESIGDTLSEKGMTLILKQLVSESVLTTKEAALIEETVRREVADATPGEAGELRARVLRAIIMFVYGQK